jgi:hypothetical protein
MNAKKMRFPLGWQTENGSSMKISESTLNIERWGWGRPVPHMVSITAGRRSLGRVSNLPVCRRRAGEALARLYRVGLAVVMGAVKECVGERKGRRPPVQF